MPFFEIRWFAVADLAPLRRPHLARNRKGIPGFVAVTIKMETAINLRIGPLVCIKRNLVGQV